MSKLQELIKTFDKVTNLDTFYFFNASFFLTIKYIIQSFSGLVIAIAFTRFTTTYIYGQYNLFISIISLISIFTIPGLALALSQSTANGYKSSLKYAFITSMKYSLAAIPVLLGASVYFLFKHDIYIAYAFIASSIFYPILYSSNLYDYYLIGNKEYKKSTYIFTTISLIIAFSLFFIILFWPNNLLAITLTFLITSSLPATFVCFAIIKNIKSLKKDRDLFNYARFITLSVNILPIISNYIDKIILAYFLGVNILAFYVVAQIIPESFKGFIKILSSSLIPKLAIVDESLFADLFNKHVFKIFLVGTIFSAVSWTIVPLVINYIFSKDYESSIYLGRVLSFSLIVYPATHLIVTKFLVHKDKIKITVYNVVSNLVKIIFYLLLIPFFGVKGLVWGVTLFSLINFIFILLFIYELPPSFKNIRYNNVNL